MEDEVSTDLVVEEHQNQIEQNAMVEERRAEATQRVQAAFVIAKRFPRNEQVAIARIATSCKRTSLAEVAIYSYPRGKDKRTGKALTVSGPSIRLAEVIAQAWGNLDFGVREVEHEEGFNGYSVIEAYCSDLETNTHQRRVFTVHHKRKVGSGAKASVRHLDDPRDVYEHVANYGARRMRACILGVIPRDVVEKAVGQVRETLKKGTGEPLIDRINRMVIAFQELGVSVELIERRLDHATNLITEDELVDLRAIYTSMKDGESKRHEWFDLSSDADGGKAAELNQTIVPTKDVK